MKIVSIISIFNIPIFFRERKFGREIMDYISNRIDIRSDRSVRFFKYCTVGGIGFIIQTVISKIMIILSVNPGVAVTFGAEGAIISNFIMNNSWTFQHRKITGVKIVRKFIQFNTVSIGSIVIQGVIVAIGTAFFGPGSWFIFMVLAIIFVVIPYSYFIYNRYIWKK